MDIKTAISNLQKYREETSSYFEVLPKIFSTKIPNARKAIWECLREIIGDGVVWRTEYDEIASWLEDNRQKGLLLMGGVGTGKTVMCTMVIPAILMTQYPNRFFQAYSAHEMNEKMKSIISRRSILIIDDIGVERPMNDFGQKFYVFNEIVDRAERLGNILIINTNLNTSEISQVYGDRTLDRLKGITKAIVFSGGQSFRGK